MTTCQGELGALKLRTLSLLPILPPCLHRPGKGVMADLLLQKGCPVVEMWTMQWYRCKGYGHFAKDCPSEDFYKIGPNGLPIQVR